MAWDGAREFSSRSVYCFSFTIENGSDLCVPYRHPFGLHVELVLT